jgi:hypothetical protein
LEESIKTGHRLRLRTLRVEANVLKEKALAVLQAVDHGRGLSADAVLGDLDILADELHADSTVVSAVA